tara:strand:- start:261 stop:1466 length:1206 start_codon:yes stop_codon:yes gene_type:complete
MRPIKLGVIFDQQISSGGGYQQSLNSALVVSKLPKDLVEVVYFTTIRENIVKLSQYNIKAKLIYLSFFTKVKIYLRQKIIDNTIFKIVKKIQKYTYFEKILVKNKIDLVYFLSPTSLPKALENLNFITTVWDLSHRDDLEFPEVRQNKVSDQRDNKFNTILPRAVAILVDSDLSKNNLSNRYGIDLQRIHVLPFESAQSTKGNYKNFNVSKKYKISNPYVFYPAQFWSHKNHIYLLNGLSELKKNYNLDVSVIFSGADKGNKDYVEKYTKKLNLEKKVFFVGFVDDEEMASLYSQSIALVMPTYFGPTNLPPLEAFSLGVPVLYPDINGLKDQVGDAALLMDLNSPKSMATHLKNILEDKKLRETLKEAGYERLKYFEKIDRKEILSKIIKEFRSRRFCWE